MSFLFGKASDKVGTSDLDNGQCYDNVMFKNIYNFDNLLQIYMFLLL